MIQIDIDKKPSINKALIIVVVIVAFIFIGSLLERGFTGSNQKESQETLPTGSAVIYRGDVNGDGSTNCIDLNMVTDSIIGKVQLSQSQKVRADFNIDGRVDVRDAIALGNRYNLVCQQPRSIEVSLGGAIVETREETYGTLKTLPGLKVETSLTSVEDDYQTNVFLETARDSILYALKNLRGNITGQTFNLLGNRFTVLAVGPGDNILISLNGIQKRVHDGDAFIGEDPNNPNWLWDLSAIESSLPKIAVENDFLYNDNTDNPPGIGECIYLPNKYAKICLDKLTVPDNGYDTLKINITQFDYLGVSTPAILIHSTRRNTNDLFITGKTGAGLFYKDYRDGKIKFVRTISSSETIAEINKGLGIAVAPGTDSINLSINTGADLKETITVVFSVDRTGNLVQSDGTIKALGKTRSMEESDELQWGIHGRGSSYIGTKDEDHRTAYGIIIRDPKAHGSNDEVILEIPTTQVKAKVSISFQQPT